MRHIEIENISTEMGEDKFQEWIEEAKTHLSEIEGKNKQERATYFSKNNHWTKLYAPMSNISKGKCWYSEAPENSGEWEIDHYRPKSKAVNCDGCVLRPDGYWWLAYEWKNYRLSGAIVNKRRRDRFKNKQEVLGKGTFFPLDIENGYIAEPGDFDCECEIPYLIDPTNEFDISLISFDQNGEVFPSRADDPFLKQRAELSIEYYGLKHTPITRGRKKIWDTCNSIVQEAQQSMDLPANNPVNINKKSKCLRKCYSELSKLSGRSEPYSMVVYSFVREKIKDNNYFWLEGVLQCLK